MQTTRGKMYGLRGKARLIFLMLAELLCNNGGIITIPEGAKYTLEDAIAVITYAVTSTANSMEAAVSELRRKMPDATIPSADTIFNYIHIQKRHRGQTYCRSSEESIQRFLRWQGYQMRQ